MESSLLWGISAWTKIGDVERGTQIDLLKSKQKRYIS